MVIMALFVVWLFVPSASIIHNILGGISIIAAINEFFTGDSPYTMPLAVLCLLLSYFGLHENIFGSLVTTSWTILVAAFIY